MFFEYHPIICWSQSNGEGRSTYNATTWSQTGEYDNSFIFHKRPFGDTAPTGAFERINYTGRNNYHWLDDNFDHAGPELEIASQFAIRKPNQKLWLSKVSYGATGYDPTTPSPLWAPGETLYERAVYEYIPQALELRYQSGAAPLCAMLIVHGESDAGVQTAANNYETNLRNNIQISRNTWGMPDLPVFLVLLSDVNTYTYKDTVRAAQMAVAADMSNVYLFNPDSLGKVSGDMPHYDTSGYRMIGAAFIEWMLQGNFAAYRGMTPQLGKVDSGSAVFDMDAYSLSSTPVTTWTDSFRLTLVTQASGGARPSWSATGLNSKPALTFASASSSHFDVNSVAVSTTQWNGAAQNVCAFLVGQISGTADQVAFEFGDTTEADFVRLHILKDVSGTRKIGWETDVDGFISVNSSAYEATLAAPFLLELRLDDTQDNVGELWLNGTRILTGAYTPRRLGNKSRVGCSSAEASFYNGQMAHLTVFRAATGESTLSKEEMARLRAYYYARHL